MLRTPTDTGPAQKPCRTPHSITGWQQSRGISNAAPPSGETDLAIAEHRASAPRILPTETVMRCGMISQWCCQRNPGWMSRRFGSAAVVRLAGREQPRRNHHLGSPLRAGCSGSPKLITTLDTPFASPLSASGAASSSVRNRCRSGPSAQIPLAQRFADTCAPLDTGHKPDIGRSGISLRRPEPSDDHADR